MTIKIERDKNLEKLLALSNIIPVITINSLQEAVPLAKKLLEKNYALLEITLRTPVALEAAKEIKVKVQAAKVGLGTILSENDFEKAISLNADFALSPGTSKTILRFAENLALPYIPGVQTASDIMLCLEHGFDVLKFFPAELAGGKEMLKAFAGPFPQVRFCPTGGVNGNNFHEWLALKNVCAVGGSWLVG